MTTLVESTYQALESDFQQLDHDQKKQKLVNIMDYLKDKVDFAPGISDFVSQSSDLSDEFLMNLYKLVMKTILETEQTTNNQHAKDVLAHIQEMILDHQEDEEKDHLYADTILNQI